jgi:excisionase family DNA binding protein
MSGNHESANVAPPTLPEALTQTDRLVYSVEEAAELLGVHYFSVYRMIQRGKLRACRVLRGKLLVPRSELLKLLKAE